MEARTGPLPSANIIFTRRSELFRPAQLPGVLRPQRARREAHRDAATARSPLGAARGVESSQRTSTSHPGTDFVVYRAALRALYRADPPSTMNPHPRSCPRGHLRHVSSSTRRRPRCSPQHCADGDRLSLRRPSTSPGLSRGLRLHRQDNFRPSFPQPASSRKALEGFDKGDNQPCLVLRLPSAPFPGVSGRPLLSVSTAA